MLKTLDGTTIREAKSDLGVHRSASTRMPRSLSKEEALTLLLSATPAYEDNRRFRSPQPFS